MLARCDTQILLDRSRTTSLRLPKPNPTYDPPNPVKMGKSWFLDPRRKTLEHFAQLALVIVAIILTGVYLNMGIRVTRSEIMIIPIVRRTPIDRPISLFRRFGS